MSERNSRELQKEVLRPRAGSQRVLDTIDKAYKLNHIASPHWVSVFSSVKWGEIPALATYLLGLIWIVNEKRYEKTSLVIQW